MIDIDPTYFSNLFTVAHHNGHFIATANDLDSSVTSNNGISWKLKADEPPMVSWDKRYRKNIPVAYRNDRQDWGRIRYATTPSAWAWEYEHNFTSSDRENKKPDAANEITEIDEDSFLDIIGSM